MSFSITFKSLLSAGGVRMSTPLGQERFNDSDCKTLCKAAKKTDCGDEWKKTVNVKMDTEKALWQAFLHI